MTARRTFSYPVALWLAAIAICSAREARALTAPATQPSLANIPDVVILDQLSKTEKIYEPVPFNHKAHAEMSLIGGKCETCHHRTPENGATRAGFGVGATRIAGDRDQSKAAQHPACRTCHEPHRSDLRQPGLKGAYHRQCLNCHREWAQANNCNICHKPKLPGSEVATKLATPDDIMGRMHPPVPEPVTHQFVAEMVPADGANVLFRHKEHTQRYGVTCATCHRDDACSRCHVGKDAPRTAQSPRHPLLDAEWETVHKNCSSCHSRGETRCTQCHYKPDQPAPEPFDHAVTGQLLDADHEKLVCNKCHTTWLAKAAPTCGTSSCHANSKTAIEFPGSRPGPVMRLPEQTPPPVKTMPAPIKQDPNQRPIHVEAGQRVGVEGAGAP